MNRLKVFADDSVEAMAKITRELGGDARIYSTRQVNGGIEIIAGPPEDDDTFERPKRFSAGKKPETDFAALLASARAAARSEERHIRQEQRASDKRAHASAASPDDKRLRALEKSVADIKAMLGSDLMANGLRAAGATPELIAVFLAQSGAYDGENADRKFGSFLARRLLHPEPSRLIAPPRVIVTLGPSGSGKTTTLAQIAARLRMQDPDARVTFVNADSTRLGAAEQLRAYGRILDIPVVDIEHVSELTEFSMNVDPDLSLLVDMPSQTDECSKLMKTIEEHQGFMAPISRIGVVAANLAADAILNMLERYPNLDALAITKLGEAQPTLGTLGALALRKAPIAWLAAHSHLTRGLKEPAVEDLENLIRGAVPGNSSI